MLIENKQQGIFPFIRFLLKLITSIFLNKGKLEFACNSQSTSLSLKSISIISPLSLTFIPYHVLNGSNEFQLLLFFQFMPLRRLKSWMQDNRGSSEGAINSSAAAAEEEELSFSSMLLIPVLMSLDLVVGRFAHYMQLSRSVNNDM